MDSSILLAERSAGFAAKARRVVDVSLTPVAYLTLPNLPLFLLRHKLTLLPHGVINLECLLVGIGSLFLPRVAVFLLLILEMAGAFAYEICYSFQFQFSDLLISLRSLGDLPALRKAEFAGVLALVVLIAGLMAFGLPRPKRRVQVTVGLLALLLVVAAMDVVDGENPFFHNRYIESDVAQTPYRLGLSPWLTLGVRGEFFDRIHSVSEQADESPMPSASAAMMAELPGGSGGVRPDIVLTVVESWGQFRNPHMAEALTAPYEDGRISAAYDVSYGTAPFDGTTVPGEVRELCHTHMGFGVLNVSASESERCLPKELEAEGYSTYALHGYVGDMFQRNSWYPKLGFEKIWFGPDLEREGLPECPGAFPGACGTAIAPWIGTHLLTKGNREPRFVYWMTLNSHIPLPLDPRLPPDTLCSSAPMLENSGALCSWFRILHAVHTSVAELAIQAAGRPTVFVLVGDHAPPFANPALRVEFSERVVPYIILMPKSLQNAGSPDWTAAHPGALPGVRGRSGEAASAGSTPGNY